MTVLPPIYKDGITAGRLDAETLSDNFCDVHPPLDPHEAQVAADRCYFCYDAPCIQACPTSIDIPLFIRQIATGTPEAAAMTIFDSNILGGMCARVCPTETLCEEACVRELAEQKPVEIGALQRFATDTMMARDEHPYSRAAATGKSVAVVGAGPAGLAAAHRLSMHGHAVTLFEAKMKSGGLNEYGIAAYKTVDNFAQEELEWLLGIGGITVENGKALGDNLSLDTLCDEFDAVFLSIGLGGVNALGFDSDTTLPAVDFIEDLRQSDDLSKLAVGRRVVVIGGGMTAVDAAVQSKLLGAEEVTIVYRREQAKMAASEHEQNHASASGVRIITNAAPVGVTAGGVEFAYTVTGEDGLVTSDETFVLPADQVLTAIGQTLKEDEVSGLKLVRGKIAINEQGQTSMAGVWAGGDCASGGDDLTVTAVAQGRDAAEDIHANLMKGA
ncbi:MAG: NAD(P)-dependent oxidoreductase [Alphaproteobacteria bacterium]